MSSTRNKYFRNNYLADKAQMKRTEEYMFNPTYNVHEHNVHIAGNGLNQGMMPRHFFSHNSVDIESELRGVWGLNIETPKPKVISQPKSFKTYDLYTSSQTIKPDIFIDDHPYITQRVDRK